jgi:hypothetical protein
MKNPGHPWRRIEGTIVLFALIVVMVGAIVMAAWVNMLASRAAFSDTSFAAAERRIALANGRALARQFILERMPGGVITNTNVTGSVSGGWGSFSIPSASSNYWTTTNFVDGNFFSPSGTRSYAVTFTGAISVGSVTQAWNFRVRSRSPLMFSVPLVIHNNATTNLVWAATTNIFWTNLNGFTGLPYVPLTSGTNSSGAGTNGYIGYYAAPIMTNVSATTATNTGYTNATSNSIELFLNPTLTSSIIRYTQTNTVTASSSRRYTNNDGTQVYSNGSLRVTALRVFGSTNTNVLQIVVPASVTNLAQIILSGTNSRRVYVNRAGAPLAISTTNFSGGTWRLCLSLSNAPLTVSAPTNGLVLQGGIRTDQTVSVTSGTLSVVQEPTPGNLDQIADRILWLEENRAP